MASRQERQEADAISYIADLVYERSRIRLHDGKQALIRARLGKRMRLHGLPTLPDYCAFLRQGSDPTELDHVVDALTTNFTSFLREADHFEWMVQEALPRLRITPETRLRIWSAACATGEEPYTIALHLADRYPPEAGWNWEVLATDISHKALATAQQAIYSADRLASLPKAWVSRFFEKGFGNAQGLFRVRPTLRDRVRFQQVNLLGPLPPGTFQIIFCRNVMIYFDRPTQEQLVRSLAQTLLPSGYLLIGHSESLNGLKIPLKCLRPSYYQRL